MRKKFYENINVPNQLKNLYARVRFFDHLAHTAFASSLRVANQFFQGDYTRVASFNLNLDDLVIQHFRRLIFA